MAFRNAFGFAINAQGFPYETTIKEYGAVGIFYFQSEEHNDRTYQIEFLLNITDLFIELILLKKMFMNFTVKLFFNIFMKSVFV